MSLTTTLEQLSARDDVERILVATHVPPFLELRSQETREQLAYRFVPTLGALILGFSKVTHVVAGHNHVGVQALIPRPGLVPLDTRVVDADAGDGRQVVHYTFFPERRRKEVGKRGCLDVTCGISTGSKI